MISHPVEMFEGSIAVEPHQTTIFQRRIFQTSLLADLFSVPGEIFSSPKAYRSLLNKVSISTSDIPMLHLPMTLKFVKMTCANLADEPGSHQTPWSNSVSAVARVSAWSPFTFGLTTL